MKPEWLYKIQDWINGRMSETEVGIYKRKQELNQERD